MSDDWKGTLTYGKVEGGNDANDAKRVPVFKEGMTRPLARDDFAGQHPGEADSIVADVNILLDLADSLGNDFSHLKTHQLAQGLKLIPESLA